MATSAKDEILRRIRAAGSIDAPSIPRDYISSREVSVVAEMEEALVDYTAIVTHCDEASISTAIDSALGAVKSVAVPVGLPQAWQEGAGNERELRIDEPALSKEVLNETDAVVTGARTAVSLTGTIMLDGGPDQGRRILTLLPDTHVIVLRASAIKATVPEAVAVLGESPTAPVTWIAGPSATSDIELVRVDGVHGPRNLRVIIVDDES